MNREQNEFLELQRKLMDRLDTSQELPDEVLQSEKACTASDRVVQFSKEAGYSAGTGR